MDNQALQASQASDLICLDNLPVPIGRAHPGLALSYTPEKFAAVIRLMVDGTSVAQACRETGIQRQTFYGWVSGLSTKDQLGEGGVEILLDIYRRAKLIQAESVIDSVGDSREKLDVEGIDSNEIQRHRARADIALRLAPMLHPGRYGPKVELSGPGGGPLQFAVMSYAVPSPAIEGERDD